MVSDIKATRLFSKKEIIIPNVLVDDLPFLPTVLSVCIMIPYAL